MLTPSCTRQSLTYSENEKSDSVMVRTSAQVYAPSDHPGAIMSTATVTARIRISFCPGSICTP